MELTKHHGYSLSALLFGALGADAQVVKTEKWNAQNKVVSAFLSSLQVYARPQEAIKKGVNGWVQI
jgi:hypothetical protein